jgi:hypothetical protein
MGNSTIKLGEMFDFVAFSGIPDPRKGPSGYGDKAALIIANGVIKSLVCERLNWKWNSAVAAPFYTNSWQQDYPQLAQPNGPIGWGEDITAININDTALPKPIMRPVPKWRKNLPRTSSTLWGVFNMCWMYNRDMALGVWPGAGKVYQPLVGNGPTAQNPILNCLDANGNILILTTFGTTGTTAPKAAANAPEGTTVTDGTVVWTVVSPTSQGFRLDNLPGATAPVWEIIPVFQYDPPLFTSMAQTLDPVPDSYSLYFREGLEAGCKKAATDPKMKQDGEKEWEFWEEVKMPRQALKQGDREMNAYGLMPAGGVVDSRWARGGPVTAGDPYGWGY